MSQFETDYGHFSDDGREYIITRPDTPMPWINVMSNGDYGVTLSQAGGGYSWRTHAGLNRISRWEQDLIRDPWGKWVYLRDADSGQFWSVAAQPCGGTVEEYRVRHGMGYSTIESRREGIASQLTCTVPFGDPCEVWLLRLENRGDAPRRLQVFTYFEWTLGAAPDWHREFQRIFIDTSYDAAHAAVLATKVLWELPDQPGPHWNRSWPYVAFHGASPRPAAHEADKLAFVGRNGNLGAPRAVVDGRLTGSTGRFGDAIASLRVDVELAPGAAREVVFTLGAADNRDQALTLVDRYCDPAAAHAALDEVRRFWEEICADLTVDTPDRAFDLMVNGWLTYQTISGRLWGRTAYYQTGGAYGFRDQLQDSLIWLLLGRPEHTLAQIRLHAAHQYQDGVVLHWWHPLSETGLRSNYSDDLLWLPYVVMHYWRETGDTAGLRQEVKFYDGGSASILEHCQRSFDRALQRKSPRGLPLLLAGDWNDGLNAAGFEGRGESVWMAHFLIFLLRGWADLPLLDEAVRARYRAEADVLQQAANRYTWDGAWYWRATTDDGAVIGSHESSAGKIYLNAQTWAILGGTAPADRARQAMDSARQHLYQPYGALLLAPAYTEPDPAIGYLTRYAPGLRENGGVYTHAACWAVLAERRLNGVNAAYQLWRSLNPVLHGNEPERYWAEPYVTPGNSDGPLSPYPGRGGWTWYTGSAGWYLRAAMEGVLGIEATPEGLRVPGELPEGWPEMHLTRRFRGASYDIRVRRAGPGEVSRRMVDGHPWAAEVLPIAASGTTQRVEIITR